MPRVEHDNEVTAGTQTRRPRIRKARWVSLAFEVDCRRARRQFPPPPPRPLFLGSFFGGITFGGVGFGTGGALSVYSVRCSTLTLGRVTLTSIRRRFLVGSGLLE